MSVSSLVSFARNEIFETIPGLQIATYRIDKAEGNMPSILLVNDSFYYKPDLEGKQDRVFVSSGDIADSIVHMHTTSQLAYRIDAHPALFAIRDREVTPAILIKDYDSLVKDALQRQRNWFIALVGMADDDWQQSKKPMMISGIQRIAGRELGLRRDWLLEVSDEVEGIVPDCPFCGKGLLNVNAPICPTCGKVINPAKLAELEMRLKIDSKVKA